MMRKFGVVNAAARHVSALSGLQRCASTASGGQPRKPAKAQTGPLARQPEPKPDAVDGPKRWAHDINGNPNPGVGNVLLSVSTDGLERVLTSWLPISANVMAVCRHVRCWRELQYFVIGVAFTFVFVGLYEAVSYMTGGTPRTTTVRADSAAGRALIASEQAQTQARGRTKQADPPGGAPTSWEAAAGSAIAGSNKRSSTGGSGPDRH
jgi:hypothetical protein